MPQSFGAAGQKPREDRSLSQERLALDADINRSYMGVIEWGERNPTLTNVFKIADARRVEPSEIHALAEALPAAEPHRSASCAG